MSDLILHHYPASPFAEKIRALLGYKGLSYHSVTIPVIMPKPDLTALTGGYRKTPVLQRGKHIYCDTRLIACVIDELGGGESIYPQKNKATVNMVANWADSQLFGFAVAYAFSPTGVASFASKLPPEFLQAFVKDRMAMRENANVSATPLDVAQSHLPQYLADMEEQLSVSGPFLLGEQPSIADFCVYHALWFIRNNNGIAATLTPFTHLNRWMDTIAGFGHGHPTDMSSEQAIDAVGGDQLSIDLPVHVEVAGFNNGDLVSVIPTDYGMDPVDGELLVLSKDEIVIRREDPRAGEVFVHFPRIGYSLAVKE